MNKLVKCGEFVKRQTKESGHSHFDGSWEDLENEVISILIHNELYPHNNNCYKVRSGYKDGVLLVDLDPTGFYSAIVDVTDETKLNASYAPRQPGEAPFIRLSAKADKQPAKYASVVLYRADVLEENNERETDAEWEIVAIKARTDAEEEPMHYYTMARNFLHLKGGTQGDFSAEDFANQLYIGIIMSCAKGRNLLV